MPDYPKTIDNKRMHYIPNINNVGDKLTWNEFQTTWGNNYYRWGDIVWFYDAFGRLPKNGYLKRLRQYEEWEQLKIIRLVCAINGHEYTMQKGKRNDIKITASDIEMALNEIRRMKPELMVENVNV
tara:strand:- start:724 stop:1101 length:378 start_codon:yes stop_codon:yes gene_type:complete